MQVYAQVFMEENALDKLEAFASFHGPDFYGLPRNTGTITLKREPWRVPRDVVYGADRLTPFRADGDVAWRMS